MNENFYATQYNIITIIQVIIADPNGTPPLC